MGLKHVVYTGDVQELSNKTHVNPTIKDVDPTPVADRQLRVTDGEIIATDTTGVEGRYIRDTSIKGTGTLVTNLNADKIDGLEGADLEKVINKGVANGYAPLDANAKLPLSHLPSHTHVKADITDFAHTHPLSDLQQSGAQQSHHCGIETCFIQQRGVNFIVAAIAPLWD